MPRKKKSKRGFKLIAFKAYYDTDQDILDWWEGIEEGERSDEMRDLIREQLGVRRQPKRGEIIDLPDLMEVRRDTLWIKDALNEMPAYLERVIQDVAANIQPVAVGQYQSRASPVEAQTDDPALTDAETQRRTRRMKRATW
ncbi:MAG: hypothetical protein K8L99_22185 [Anaerolineae bacterium]|nr:hypothetical protein [Anaerolineae bacterium]